MTELTDLSETDASNILITAINIDEGCAPSGINNAIRNTLGLIRRAFKSSIFRLRDSTDQTKLLAYDISPLTTATTRTQIVPDENGRQALAAHLSGHLYGLTLSNNVADATNDIDIAAGNAIDSTNAHVITLASALTKRLDAAWAVGTGNGGLDTGSIANATYHVFVIKRVDTGVVDVLFSASTSPTLPANYTLYRRIGSFIRSGATILAFSQRGDEFLLNSPPLDVNSTNPGTSAVTQVLTLPSGIVVDALISGAALFPAVLAASAAIYYSPLSVADSTPLTNGVFSMIAWYPGANQYGASGAFSVRSNTSAQIRTRLSLSDSSTVHRITTRGWIDTRGRDA